MSLGSPSSSQASEYPTPTRNPHTPFTAGSSLYRSLPLPSASPSSSIRASSPLKTVRTVKPPKLNTGRGRILSLPSDSGDSSDGGEDSEDWDVDSEEEEWPVGPVGSVGLRGWRKPNGKGKLKDPNQSGAVSTPFRGGADVLDVYDEKERASTWATASRSFHLSLSRSLSASPAPVSKRPSDVDDIQTLLSTLALAQSRAQATLVASFESRNAALWSSIESSIKQAEKEESEKQRMMEENRKKGEEAEKKARTMREVEVERIKAEEVVALGKKEEARKEVEKKKVEEAERVTVAAAAAAKAVAQLATAEKGSPRAEWERWTAKMTHIKNAVLPTVSQNPAYRKTCFTAKRSITPKIGQLTSSSSATSQIISQLDALLSSLRPPPGQDTAIEPYIWTLNHLAKALVKQAETEVTAKLATAYPLGRVVIGLIARGHTELGDVLMARLVKKCFWITGYFPPRRPDQTDEQHQKVLGHAPPTITESLSQYASRQAGLIALYASILQTSPLLPPQGPCPDSALSNIPPHFRPSAGWNWLTLILRPPLVSLEPTPLLLITFLEIAGEGMLEIYGRQMGKFLMVLRREGLEGGQAGFSEKARASLVRLGLWLEEWEGKGRVEGTKGRESDP